MPDNNKPLSERLLNSKKFNIGTNELDKKGSTLETLGNTTFGNSEYDDKNLNSEFVKSGDYQYLRGEKQSGLGQIGLGVLRAASKAAVEIGKTPAYLYSLGEWSLDNISKGGKGVTLDQALDNAWLNTLESLDDSIKNEIPVYHSYKSGKGGILDNIASTSFWSSEGADGVGYLLGLIFPGAALKGLNLASKISKLGVGVELSKDIELGTLTLLNSSVEALAEAKGVADRLKAEGASPEQIAEACKATFYANIALLVLPNAIMNKNLLGRFKADKSILDEFKDASGKLMENPVIKKDALKQYSKSIFGSALPEGVEGGGQTSIENYEVAKATGKTDLGFIKGVANEFLTTMNTTEGLKSVVLDLVLGSFGGAVGTFKQRKADQEYRNENFGTISQLIKDNFEGFSGDNEIYDRDENGVQTSINPTKLKEATEDFINEITESKLKDLSALNDDKVLHDYLDNKIFTRAAIPFLKLGDVGLELLNDKIDNASLTASKINQLDILDENKYKTEQKNKAKQLLGLYNDTMNVVSQFASVKALEGREGYEEYLDKMFNASFQEVSKQVFYKEKIQDLNNELSKYNSVIFNDLPQNQIQVAKYQKQIDGLNKLLEQSKEKYNSLQNTSEQIKALNEFIEQKIKSEKIVKDVQNAEKEAVKKQKDKQVLDEVKSDVDVALESMTIDEFNSLHNKLKNDPLVNDNQRKSLIDKAKNLDKIITTFAEAIKNGTVTNDAETQEFYANNKTHIEAKLKEFQDKEVAPPTFSELLNKNLESKKADIKRRRQEELSKYEGRRANAFVKYNPEGSNTELTQDEIDEIELIINKASEKGWNVDRLQQTLASRGYVHSIGNSVSALRNFLQARLNGEINYQVNGNFLNEINAKYDAELQALESTATTETSIEAKKADIERRRKLDLFKNTPEQAFSGYANDTKLTSYNEEGAITDRKEGKSLTGNRIQIFKTLIDLLTEAFPEKYQSLKNIFKPNPSGNGYYITINDFTKAINILKKEGINTSKEGLTQLLDLKKQRISEINAKYDAEYIDKVKKGEFTKQQAKDALKEINRLTPELEKQIDDAELAALGETSGVSGSALKDVVPVFHHTKVDVKDFDFGNFQRGKNQVSQFGDGLAVSTDTTPFLQKRYGNPIKGEVKDSDFVVIDTNKTEKEIYEELKSKGYKFNKPDSGSYIGNDPAKEYNGTERANENPAIISLFNDFQKSNPEVKGVKIVNHIIANEKVSPFYVIYDNKSFYGEGSLKESEEESSSALKDVEGKKADIERRRQEELKSFTEREKESVKKSTKGTPINKDNPNSFKVGQEYNDGMLVIVQDVQTADNFDANIAENEGEGYTIIDRVLEYGEMKDGKQSKAPILRTRVFNNKEDADTYLEQQKQKFDSQIGKSRQYDKINAKYDAELATLENNNIQQSDINVDNEHEQDVVSENNQLVIDDEVSQKHPITDNQVESKGINRKNNVAMMHLFEHYFDNDFFKFKRQEGFPKLDNTSNINIKSINDIKIGDTINFKFVEVSPEISSLYEGLKDYDGKHIGIYKDNDLLGFVQQPHEISTKSSDPDLSKRLRDGLITYRKYIIKELNSNKEVVEKVLDKGTGNLYTKLDKQGRIDPVFDVLETARPKDKIENQLVFVYSNSLGKLTLPDNTDLDEGTINTINLRLAKLNKFDSKKGRVFQLVKDLNGDWSPIPVYPNVLNKETLDKISEVLSTSNNDNEPNDIIRRLQPYVYSTEFKRGVPITIKKEGGVIKLWNANGLVTLDEFQNNKFKNKSFLEGLKGVKQNISINDINKPSFQEDMKNRKSLLTNVTTFEGEYFVQPYIEYTQSISKKLNEASAQDNIELDQLQPSINDTDLNSKVKDKLKSIDLDTPINDDNALSINHDNTLLNKVKFQKWLSSRLPQLKLSDVDSIYQLKDVMIDSFGLFRDSTIYLFEGAGMKTAYHEAFHGVFRNLLTIKQRQDIINEAVSKYPQPTELEINNLKQSLKNKYSSEQLLYLYYEEKLADDFAKYAYDRNDSNFWVKLGNKIKDFFNKIFNFYRIFKSNDTTTIDDLFSNINAGRLATLNSKSNSVVNRSLFNEYAYSKALNSKLGVSTKVKIVKSIGNKFLAEYQQAIFNEQKVDSFTILKNIQDSYKKELVSGKLSEADEKECARIIVNFPDIWNEVKKYLEYRNIKSKLVLGYNTIKEEIEVQEEGVLEFKTDLTQESVEDIETYSLESKTVKGLGEWTSISGLSSASTRLKLFLSSIPIIKDGNVVKDNLGVTQYHEFSDLYYYIERNLIDKYELSEQLNVLKELAINRPVLNQIIDKLSNKPSEMSQEQFDLLVNDFKTNFSKQQLAYTLIKFDNENGNYSYKIIDANRSSLGREIFNQFEINVADPTKDVVGYYDKDGNRVIDASKAKDVLQAWDKLFSKLISYESVNALLNKVGIEYTPEVLKKILSSDISVWKNQVTTLMKWYASDFPINEEKEGRKALSQLVAYEVDNLMEKYTSSFINGENKNIYTIQLPSFISKTVAKIKNRDKFKLWKADLQKDDFYYKSNLLEALDNKEYRESFKVSYMDSFKDERGSREGVGFTSLTPKDYLNTEVALFQNTAVNSQKQTTMPVSKYIYITPSDKTMCVIIDASRYDVAIDPVDGSDLDLRKSPIFNKYYNVVLSEAIRIAKANNVKNDIIANKGEGKYNLNELEEHYHMSKSSFKKLSNMILEDKLDWDVIPTLFDGQAYKFNYFSLGFNNKVLAMTKEIFESSANKNDIIKAFDNLDTRQSIMKLLEAELNKDYKESVKEFERKGLIERLPNGLYKNKSLQLTSETKFVDGIQEQVENSEEVQDRQIKHLIANFSLNTLLHNIEFSNIFNGDFAQYKPKDLQKRTYQSQAMTVFGNFINKIIKTVVVKDVEVASESYNSIVDTLKSQGFTDAEIEEIAGKYSEGINVTDAQVYISPEFYKRIHVARGTWTSEMQEAFDIIENGSKGNIKESLHRLLGGIKPYYFGNRFDPKFEKQKFEQVKCAMLPLFKGYCDLNPLLAKKREQMLTDGVDMIAHESSFKAAIGFRNTISDDVEYLKLDLSTDNFGVQVDNPDHMDEGNDSMRQLKMLILGSIDKSKLYNDIKGDVIISNILNMEAENLADSLKELKDKMDVKSNINFAHFIKEMVTKRGATINVEEILNIVNGNFEYALDSGNIATQVENMISSIFTNNVIKQKFSVGGSAVQATALGFKYKNLAEQQDNLPQEALDLQTDLKWIKPEDGKISYAECAMPAWTKEFFDKKGNLIDIDSIPDELKQLIAYRIPTEGLHSMMPIKVVKFLPPTMGNFILLPYEVTTQFGADFDFDKVYFFGKEFFKDENNNLIPYKYYTGTDKKSTQSRYYQYSYTVSPKEKLSYEDFEELSVKEQNVRASRNNNIVDNYLTLLTSINNLHLLVSPSGFTQLENFQKTYFPNYDEYNFFSSRTQRDFKERNHIGIALKGQAALHVSGHSYGVLMDLNSTDYNEDGSLDITRSVNINGSNRTNFSGLYTDNGKLIADELASIMAAILDDIKNPLLEPLGINNNTIDVLATMIRSGVNMKTALMFTSQPAVKHLSKILAGNKNKVKDVNEGYLQIDDLIDSYTKLAESSLDKLEDKDNPTYQGYIKVMNSNKPEHVDINEKDMLNIIETYRIDGDEILKGHSVEGKNKLSFKKANPLELLEYYSYQVRVLNQFKNIESIAKELVKINKFFAINKEVGPNIEDIIAKRDILDNINGSNIVKGFNIDSVPSLKETWSTHEYALDWFESYFPYSTNAYMNIKNAVIKNQSKKSLNEVSIEERQYMNNFIRTYTDYMTDVFKDVPDNYNHLLNKFPVMIKNIKDTNNKDLKIGANTYEQIKNNLFIQNIKIELDKQNKIWYIQSKGNRLDLQVKNNIIEAFTALYRNVNTKPLAIDFIKHSFLTTGFFRGLNSYSQFISPEILKDLGYNDYRKNLISNLKDDMVVLSGVDEARLVDLIIRNNSKDFTKKFDGEMFNVKSNEPLPNKLVTNEALVKAAGRANDMIWYTYNEDGRVLNTPKYISVYDKFNRKPEIYVKTDDFSYEKTTILGKPGYLFEINPYINIEKSYLKYNNDKQVDENIEKLNKPVLEENIPNEEYEGYANNLFGEVNENFINEDINPEEGTTKNPEDC